MSAVSFFAKLGSGTFCLENVFLWLRVKFRVNKYLLSLGSFNQFFVWFSSWFSFSFNSIPCNGCSTLHGVNLNMKKICFFSLIGIGQSYIFQQHTLASIYCVSKNQWLIWLKTLWNLHKNSIRQSNSNISGTNPEVIWVVQFFRNTKYGYQKIKCNWNDWEYKWSYTQRMLSNKFI